jgi:anti-anti-sigma regulatory factor
MSAGAVDPRWPRFRAPRREPSDFTVVIGRVFGTVVVTVRGTLDAAAAGPLERLLRDLVDNQGNRAVSIDLRAASPPDPAVAEILVAVAASAKRRGSSFSLLEPSAGFEARAEGAGY